ncbi:acyltransferase [Neobacillus sp. 179-J 1A1 HS]|uniref:acyltransferase family protein n=1 Tax=Neobacillus driksii TaxID=3035913 RepID=UPI0035BC8688
MNNLTVNIIKGGSKASSILDLLRFISAFIVFLFHFYVPLPGYQAVMVFFVLSGYFISATILKSLKENRWSWSEYFLKRVIRLWIVLLPCLISTFLLANLQMMLFGSDQKIGNFLDVKSFLGNLFFLQGILVGNYGLNGPLWSLSYEFWYYILFPCLVFTVVSKKLSIKVLFALVFILISLFVGQRIMMYFLIWMTGALIPLVKPLKLKNNLVTYIILILATIMAFFSTQYESGDWVASWSNFAPDFRVGVAFSILIYLIVSFYNDKPSIYKINIPKHLSGFSYTLYLAHYPLANLILTWLVSPLWPFSKTTLTIKMVFAGFVLLYSWFLALITERHTNKVRKFIFNIVFRNRSKVKETIFAKSNVL